ncbi:unnamed protein product [Calypogeia fissa]
MAALGTVGAIKSLVYDTVFKRAQEIAASEKLLSVVFEGEGLLKGTAECIGSSPSDVYKLSVSIDGASAVGDCSCPAGKSAKSGLCKHAVALLLRRLQEIQGTKSSPSGSPPEEVVTSIASQRDDITTRQDPKKSADGRKSMESTVGQGSGPPASSSKRALPAWMLGVVGSAAQTPSSIKAKSNKRAAEPKLPIPPPPPTKRSRRSGQPLKISNGSDKEDEDPGEVHDAVHDAAPMEKGHASEVTEEDKIPETINPPSEGATARERRRLRALKKEAIVVADDKGKEEVKRTRGRSDRAVSKEVVEQPVRATKRRRLAKKYVEEEEDSDGSENAAAHVVADASNCFDLSDDELLLLAQEQLEKEKATEQPEDLTLTARVEPNHEEKEPDSSQGKKTSSIFSMNKWKEMTSEGRGAGGVLSLATDDLDLETLKSYSFAASSQSTSQSDNPALNADALAEPATSYQDIQIPTPTATGYHNSDAATDMLNIFFGSSLSQVSQTVPKYSAAEVGLEAPTTLSSVPEGVNVAPADPPARIDRAEVGGEFKPKKKSSLKDRVKMLLS